jgi:hypothetical protein
MEKVLLFISDGHPIEYSVGRPKLAAEPAPVLGAPGLRRATPIIGLLRRLRWPVTVRVAGGRGGRPYFNKAPQGSELNLFSVYRARREDCRPDLILAGAARPLHTTVARTAPCAPRYPPISEALCWRPDTRGRPSAARPPLRVLSVGHPGKPCWRDPCRQCAPGPRSSALSIVWIGDTLLEDPNICLTAQIGRVGQGSGG